MAKKDGKKILGKKAFGKRIDTLVTKAGELHTLCDVSVLLVCRGTNGELDTWPPLNSAELENAKSRYYHEINGNIHQPKKKEMKKPKTNNSKSEFEERINFLEKELGLTPTGKKNTSASVSVSDCQFWSQKNKHQIALLTAVPPPPLHQEEAISNKVDELAGMCGINSHFLLNQGEAANNVPETEVEVDDLSKLCGIKPVRIMISNDTTNMSWLNPLPPPPAFNQHQYQDTSILAPLPEALMIPSPPSNYQFYYRRDYGMPSGNCEFYNPSMCYT